mmetsp:Transcript_13932/g.45475  ORF Transcript_13932/g.45475 Transcript_13932/m.45475 type:complete len:252 (+) Transcript_13932:90-845(+)
MGPAKGRRLVGARGQDVVVAVGGRHLRDLLLRSAGEALGRRAEGTEEVGVAEEVGLSAEGAEGAGDGRPGEGVVVDEAAGEEDPLAAAELGRVRPGEDAARLGDHLQEGAADVGVSATTDAAASGELAEGGGRQRRREAEVGAARLAVDVFDEGVDPGGVAFGGEGDGVLEGPRRRQGSGKTEERRPADRRAPDASVAFASYQEAAHPGPDVHEEQRQQRLRPGRGLLRDVRRTPDHLGHVPEVPERLFRF